MELTATDWAALVSTLLLGLSAGDLLRLLELGHAGASRSRRHSFVTAFNSINVAIQNPLFFVVFVGALIAPAVTAVLAFVAGEVAAAWLAVAATAVYLVGVLVVTGAVNVPLNNALAQNRDRRPSRRAGCASTTCARWRASSRSGWDSPYSRRVTRAYGVGSLDSEVLGLGDGLGGSDGVAEGDGLTLTVHW